jgi:L-fuculose-phosphate aldolase
METPAEQIAYVGRRMFERRLADMAGGNVSVRDGNMIYISPRYSGSRHHWQLNPEEIISGPIDTDELLDNPRFSREGKAHLAVYRHFPEVTGIIHSHPFHILPFCVAERAIEPVLEATQKFGVVEVVKGAPAHGEELAANIVEGLRGKEASIQKQAAAVLMPKHGILVAGKHLMAAIDALERIDWNAYCIMAQSFIPATPLSYTPPGG